MKHRKGSTHLNWPLLTCEINHAMQLQMGKEDSQCPASSSNIIEHSFFRDEAACTSSSLQRGMDTRVVGIAGGRTTCQALNWHATSGGSISYSIYSWGTGQKDPSVCWKTKWLLVVLDVHASL